MKYELKERSDDYYSPPKGFPSRIIDKYEPLSCLKYIESRRVYLFREKAIAKRW